MGASVGSPQATLKLTSIQSYKYLDGINHPDTCWTIRPLYSVPVSLLSPEPQLDNAESRTLDPSDFLARQLS